MTKKENEKYTVKINSSIRKAIKKMDENGEGIIVCVDRKGMLRGIVTDGDFRRAILSGVDLRNKIIDIANKDFLFLNEGYEDEEARTIFTDTVVSRIPILKEGKLVDLLLKDEFFQLPKKGAGEKVRLNLPVVLMAGGVGSRLDPFTRILPKALIPVGNKPLIEIIMDRFAEYGVDRFYISVNVKARMIKAYFEDSEAPYAISYIEENKPLGSAGSLKALEGNFDSPIFVTNCDIIVETDYADILRHHKEQKNDLTLVASMQHYTIPYGVCEIEEGGLLKEMKEKPEYDFLVNSGLYLFNPGILSLIPPKKHCDMTDLIKLLKAKGRRVGVYPVSEKSWNDFGEWKKYRQKVGDLDAT